MQKGKFLAGLMAASVALSVIPTSGVAFAEESTELKAGSEVQEEGTEVEIAFTPYEGYEIDDSVLYVNVSGSTDLLVNKLHSYFVFFTMDKEEAEKLDKAEFNVFFRD